MAAPSSTASDSRWADRLGMLNAFICLMHCLALPMLATIGSISSLLLESIWLDLLFIAISYFAVYRASRKVPPSPTLRRLWLWASVFAVALIMGHLGYLFFDYVSYFSSVMLAWTHFKHYRESSRCPRNNVPNTQTEHYTVGQEATQEVHPKKAQVLS